MPAVHSKCDAAKQQEREARNGALEADRQGKIKSEIERAVTCDACSIPFTESHKHMAYSITCGHSFCSLCVHDKLPAMHRELGSPLACPVCRATFQGKAYLAARNYAMMAVAECYSDATNPGKRVGARDVSPEPADLAASCGSPGRENARKNAARASTLPWESPEPEEGAPSDETTPSRPEDRRKNAARASTLPWESPEPEEGAREGTMPYQTARSHLEERSDTLVYAPPAPDARGGTMPYETARSHLEERSDTLVYAPPAPPPAPQATAAVRLCRFDYRFHPY